jgi:hypothetical protein
VRRGPFIGALACSALAPSLLRAAGAPPPPDVDLPALYKGGRPFLRLTAVDGSRVLAWLDTDGSGFITRAAAKRLGLSFNASGRAALPAFAEQLPPVGGDGTLPVIDPDPKDPVLAGIDVQLGATWFAGRVWTIDYRNEQIVWNVDGHDITSDAINPVKLHFQHAIYPTLPVVVEGELIEMSLDTAATVVERAGTIAATSFITHDRLAKWHAAHPDWPVQNVSPGVDRIEVTEVKVLSILLGSVSFTTRPNDDVFEGGTLAGKLGSNAWAFRVLMLDYVRGFAAFD